MERSASANKLPGFSPGSSGTLRSSSMTNSAFQEAFGHPFVRVDAAVAEEGPVAPDLFRLTEIATNDQVFFAIVCRLGNHFAKRTGNERAAPEFEPAIPCPFVTDAIDRGNVNAVGNRMSPLHGLPGLILLVAKLGFLLR